MSFKNIKSEKSRFAKGESLFELSSWQKEIIDERLKDHHNKPNDVIDFEKTIDDIEKTLLTNELKESIEYLNLVTQGKKKARNAKDLLNEL